MNHKNLLNRVLGGQDLTGEETESFVGAVMDGAVDDVVVAAVLAALRTKGETGVEIAAAARAMRARALPVPLAAPGRAVDTCGTGGDGADTINISTAAALLAAAAGVPVAKHGNRSVSSKCGSADVLEAAGVQLDLGPEQMAALHDEIGIAFLFAPRLHPAMKAVMPVRRALAVRTVFNLLGPLTNPAGVSRQVIGVWGAEVQDLMAGALVELDAKHALVVHSEDGLDEISVNAPTRVLEVRDGRHAGEWRVKPDDLGIVVHDPTVLTGGAVSENLRRMEEILGGREDSAARDAVAVNAAAALLVAGTVENLGEGLELSRETLSSGAGLDILEVLGKRSTEMKQGV